MKLIDTWPLKWKLTTIFLLVTGFSLLVASLVFTYYDLQIYKQERLAHLQVLIDATYLPQKSNNLIENPNNAKVLLAALGKDKQVESAAIYDNKDQLLAFYHADKDSAFQDPSTLKPGQYHGVKTLEIVYPLLVNNRLAGKIFVRASSQFVQNHLLSLLNIAGLTIPLTLVLAYLLARKMQTIITHPILSLADSMRQFTKNPDYSMRVPCDRKDEMGYLYQGFNAMLEAIEERDSQLANQRHELENTRDMWNDSEYKLEKSLNIHQAIIDNAFDAIVSINHHGAITSWNRRAESILGWKAEEVVDKKMQDIIIPDSYREEHEKAFNRFLTTGQAHVLNQQIELSALHKLGHELPVEISISATREQESYLFTGIIRDISQRKQQEAENLRIQNELNHYKDQLELIVVRQTADLQETLKDLKESNEMKNKFLGIASHDLRNPIYLIRSYSEILIDESLGPLTQKQKSLMQKIFNSSQYMTGLIENLLDISRIESGKIYIDQHKIDFNRLIQEQVELLQLLANKKNIRLVTQLKPLPEIYCDNNAMIQVMGNFIGNAIKFSPPGTQVDISTENLENSFRFSVKDEGPGICEEEQKLAFGEFQTLSPKPTGEEKSTGLGLAIVKKIIHLHEGEVGVKSIEGQGATFFFTLPFNENHSHQQKDLKPEDRS